MLILNMKIISLCVALLLLQCCETQQNYGSVEYNVEMDVFSGRPNPTWKVDMPSPVYNRLSSLLSRVRSTRMMDKLGYRGFVVEMRDALGLRRKMTVGAGSSPALEMLLLNSSPYPLAGAVRQTVMDAIRRTFQPRPPLTLGNIVIKDVGKLPVCHPPTYDPTLWNLEPTVYDNNCYNYATQRRTDTFAQPGRATGQQYSHPIEAKNVLYATIRDGFIPVPFVLPWTCGIALVIWPGVDFHFYRLDSNWLWSHKPGGTPAKNTDDSGLLISDPRTADRGEYTVFAGYLLNHPFAMVN